MTEQPHHHAHHDHGHHDHGHHDHGHHGSAARDSGGHRMTAADWDEMYSERGQVWTAEPNHALTTEVAGLAPGRAVDVGCGEGADAIWLAGRGWRVTAIDPSQVALDRAAQAAQQSGVEVRWVRGGLDEVELPEAGFDLVLSFYPTLYRETGPVAGLTRLVAPGGTLLVVHHVGFDPRHYRKNGADPADLVMPDEIARQLGDGWTVVAHDERDRAISGGAGAHHHTDLVVRAVRDA